MSKKVEALKAIVSSLNVIIGELETDGANVEVNTSRGSSATKAGKLSSSRKAVDTASVQSEGVTEDSLSEMGYNDLKSLAKQLGVNAKGSRDELINRILSAGDSEESAKEPEATTPVEEPKLSKRGKLGKSSVKSEPVEEDPLYAKVEEAVADMSDEELLDMLHEVGVKAKGKRQSLISYAVKAVRDGLIDLDDESEDSNSSEESAPDEEMTSERAEAIKNSDAEIDEQFNNGDISRDDLVEWYAEAFGEKVAKVNKMSDEDLLTAYKESVALFIDDEGESHEEQEAYTINGEAYCCGVPCKVNEDDNTFVCECCGGEYEGGNE